MRQGSETILVLLSSFAGESWSELEVGREAGLPLGTLWECNFLSKDVKEVRELTMGCLWGEHSSVEMKLMEQQVACCAWNLKQKIVGKLVTKTMRGQITWPSLQACCLLCWNGETTQRFRTKDSDLIWSSSTPWLTGMWHAYPLVSRTQWDLSSSNPINTVLEV